MIFTSYFFSKKIQKIDLSLISVAYSIPEEINSKLNINKYKPLYPKKELLYSYKENIISSDEYTERYYKDVLLKLDPDKVFKDIGFNSVLLCWEKPKEFCHRHLIAKWLNDNLNCGVKEL